MRYSVRGLFCCSWPITSMLSIERTLWSQRGTNIERRLLVTGVAAGPALSLPARAKGVELNAVQSFCDRVLREGWKQLELHNSSSAFSPLGGRKAVGESECRDANFQLRVCVHARCLNVSIKEKKKSGAAWRCCDTVPVFVCVFLSV